MIIKAMILARKIHRVCVLFATLLILIMAASGAILKYSEFLAGLNFIDFGLVRYLHNSMSPYLATVLFVMAGTGLTMYFGPKLIARKRPTQKS